MHWAPPKVQTVPRVFDWLVRLRRAQAWLLVLFCADAVALADLLSGPDVWLGPVYLLVICVAAWSLGWVGGQATGVACMVVSLTINGLSLYPYSQAEFVWNLLMRFGAISVVSAAIAGARWAYVREWWLARSDSLTGTLNRKAFFELAQTAIDARRWRLLVYVDLDGFKKLNDARGHAAGDASLRAFGTSVRKMIRPEDVFARLGGDEFVIFMNVKDEASAWAVSTRLHQAMNNVQTENGTLDCSAGGLAVPPGFVTLDELLQRADYLMYTAKLRGAGLQLDTSSGAERAAIDPGAVLPRGVRTLARKGSANDRRTEPLVDAPVGAPHLPSAMPGSELGAAEPERQVAWG